MKEHSNYHNELQLKCHDTGNGWTFVLASAWENSVNAAIGIVRMFFSPHALKSLDSIEKIQLRIISYIKWQPPAH